RGRGARGRAAHTRPAGRWATSWLALSGLGGLGGFRDADHHLADAGEVLERLDGDDGALVGAGFDVDDAADDEHLRAGGPLIVVEADEHVGKDRGTFAAGEERGGRLLDV